MQVVAPMTFFGEPGIAEPSCKCEPPFPGTKQAVPEVRAVPDDDLETDEDEVPDEDSSDEETEDEDADEEEF